MKVREIKHLFNRNETCIFLIEHAKKHGEENGFVWLDHDQFQESQVVRIEPYKRRLKGDAEIRICV